MKVYTLNVSYGDGMVRGFGVYSTRERAEAAAHDISLGSMEENFRGRGEGVGWLIHEVTLDRNLPRLVKEEVA